MVKREQNRIDEARYRGTMMNRYIYEATLEKEDSGKYYVYFPEFSGVCTSGKDINEAVSKAGEALELAIATCLDDGNKLPAPRFRGSEGNLVRIGISVIVTDEMRLRMKCVTPSEAAKMLGVSKGRISQLLDAGVIQPVPFGNERLVTLASIHERLCSPRLTGRPRKLVAG